MTKPVNTRMAVLKIAVATESKILLIETMLKTMTSSNVLAWLLAFSSETVPLHIIIIFMHWITSQFNCCVVTQLLVLSHNTA